MQKFKTTFFASALLLAMSFTDIQSLDVTILETKVYGTCGCENTTQVAPKVELTINPDHTFQYQNASNPAKKVDVRGTWAMNGKKIVLKADGAENAFHKNWKFDKNELCVVSRKGLEFIRLCDVEACR